MAIGFGVLDFGVFPGSNAASVAITGQTSILATSAVEAWMMAEDYSGHTANDATYASLFTAISCSVPTPSTGFTIYARSTEKLQGQFKVRWVWAD